MLLSTPVLIFCLGFDGFQSCWILVLYCHYQPGLLYNWAFPLFSNNTPSPTAFRYSKSAMRPHTIWLS